MIFSSLFFIFAFLPFVIVCYYGQHLLFKNRLRNLTRSQKNPLTIRWPFSVNLI